jgi:hypothetical protein
MLKDTLIVVSTFNRQDLTGIMLDSLKRCKGPCSDVLILDDASEAYPLAWLQRWGWPVERREMAIGVGAAARARYTRFLEADRSYQYLCALDNDLIFGAQFDHVLRRLWRACHDPSTLTVLTGYRSVTQKMLEEQEEVVVVDGVGGASQFVDRPTAQSLVDAMVPDWDHTWDRAVSLVFQRKLAVKRSLVQHLGIHGTGVNGVSADVAYDFVGEGLGHV